MEKPLSDFDRWEHRNLTICSMMLENLGYQFPDPSQVSENHLLTIAGRLLAADDFESVVDFFFLSGDEDKARAALIGSLTGGPVQADDLMRTKALQLARDWVQRVRDHERRANQDRILAAATSERASP